MKRNTGNVRRKRIHIRNGHEQLASIAKEMHAKIVEATYGHRDQDKEDEVTAHIRQDMIDLTDTYEVMTAINSKVIPNTGKMREAERTILQSRVMTAQLSQLNKQLEARDERDRRELIGLLTSWANNTEVQRDVGDSPNTTRRELIEELWNVYRSNVDRESRMRTIVDTGATRHFVSVKEYLDLKDLRDNPILVSDASGKVHSLSEEGNICAEGQDKSGRKTRIDLGSAHLWRGSGRTLLSMSKLAETGWAGRFDTNGGELTSPSGSIIKMIRTEEGLYEIRPGVIQYPTARDKQPEKQPRRAKAMAAGDASTKRRGNDKRSKLKPPENKGHWQQPTLSSPKPRPRRSPRLDQESSTLVERGDNESPAPPEREDEPSQPRRSPRLNSKSSGTNDVNESPTSSKEGEGPRPVEAARSTKRSVPKTKRKKTSKEDPAGSVEANHSTKRSMQKTKQKKTSKEDPAGSVEANHSKRRATQTSINRRSPRLKSIEGSKLPEDQHTEPTDTGTANRSQRKQTEKEAKRSRSEAADSRLEKECLATISHSKANAQRQQPTKDHEIHHIHGWNEVVEARRREWLRVHTLLGHPSKRTTDAHMKDGTFGGITALPPEELKFCDICQRTKMGRANPTIQKGPEADAQREMRRAKKPFEKICLDVAGPFAHQGIRQETHFLVIVDEYTSFTRVYPLKSTGDAYEKVIEYLKWIRTLGASHDDSRVERARLDRGTEFTSGWFKRVMVENGIKLEYSNVNHPTQNGKAERTIRTIKEISSCLINQSSAPISWWPFAVQAAAHLHNMIKRYKYDVSGEKHLSPLCPREMILGEMTNKDFQRLKPWGSRVIKWARHHKTYVDRGDPHYLIGYAENTPGYWLLSEKTGRVSAGSDIAVQPLRAYTGPESRPTHTDDSELRRLAKENKRKYVRKGTTSTDVMKGTDPRRKSNLFDETKESSPKKKEWRPPADGGAEALSKYIDSLPEASPVGRALYTFRQARYIFGQLRKDAKFPIKFDVKYKKGKKSIDRWRQYNTATTVAQARTMGATSADLSYDILYGLCMPGDDSPFDTFKEAYLDPLKKKGKQHEHSSLQNNKGSVNQDGDEVTSEQASQADFQGDDEEAEVYLTTSPFPNHREQYPSPPSRVDLDRTIAEMESRHEGNNSCRAESRLEFAKMDLAAAAYHEQQLGMIEPTTVPQARRTPQWKEGWEPAILKEKASLEKLKVFEIVPKSECRRPMDGKTVLKIKLNADGTIDKYKARLVVRGFQQIENVNYHETNAPVVAYHTLRTLVSYATTLRPKGYRMYQWDIPTAFLHASLPDDEVLYMSIPEGMDTPEFPRSQYIWRLRKGLYGSKQGARLWQKRMETFLYDHGWVQAISDDCLYIFNEGDEVAYLAVYVDDLNLVCNSDRIRKTIFHFLHKEFGISMDDIDDEVEYLLGIKVAWDERTQSTSLTQELAIDKLVAAADMVGCVTKQVPMAPGDILWKNEGSEDTSFPYRTVIGICLYLSQVSRPDIAFASSTLSKYVANPSSEHVKSAKYLVKYLKGTRSLGIKYYASGSSNRNDPKWGHSDRNKVITYADAAYADDVDSRSSTQGFVCMMNGGAIAWQATTQKWVTLSTTESEVAGCVSAAKEVLGLRVLTRELGIPQPGSSVIWQDNQGAIYQQRGTKLQRKAKHYLIKLAWARDVINRGDVHIDYCTTDLMRADPFTKALPPITFIKHRDHILGANQAEFDEDTKTRGMAITPAAGQGDHQVEVMETKFRSQTNANSQLSCAKPNGRGEPTPLNRAKPRLISPDQTWAEIVKRPGHRHISDQGKGRPHRPHDRKTKDSVQMITEIGHSTPSSQKGQAASLTPDHSPPEERMTPKAPTWTDRSTVTVKVTKAKQRNAADKLRKTERVASLKARLHDLPDEGQYKLRDQRAQRYSKSRGERMTEEADAQRTVKQQACKRPRLASTNPTEEPG